MSWELIWNIFKSVWTALLSVAAVIIGCLLLVLKEGETLANISFFEWLIIGSMVLASFGFTFKSPTSSELGARRQVQDILAK